VFGRKRDEAAAQPAAAEELTETPTQGKGAPTPKRNAQVASRKRPLVTTDRKAAREAARNDRLAAQERLRIANETGDDRYMMARDKGPQKRFARNFVDARFMVGEFLMFAIFAFLIVSLVVPSSAEMQVGITFALWAVLGITVLDAFLMTRQLKKRLAAKFGQAERGVLWYAAMRGLQFRKLRMPKPLVKRGQSID
jgi:hypothetical protein